MIMEQLFTVVPVPRTDRLGWGVVCPVHRDLNVGTGFLDRHSEDAANYARAIVCDELSHVTGEYPTVGPDRHPVSGYRVRFDVIRGVSGWVVDWYVGAYTRLWYPRPESWTDAHRRAFLASRR